MKAISPLVIDTSTVMAAEPRTPSLVAEIAAGAISDATPVTSPVAETVATVGLLLVQVTTRSASTRPRESRTVATSRIVSPTARVAAVGAMVTDATGGGGAIESVPQAATRTTPALSARRMFIGRNLEARAGRWVAE